MSQGSQNESSLNPKKEKIRNIRNNGDQGNRKWTFNKNTQDTKLFF